MQVVVRKRKKTPTFSGVFDRLRAFCSEGGVEYALHSAVYVDTTDVEDQRLERLDVHHHVKYRPDVGGCTYELDGMRYFACYSESDMELPDDVGGQLVPVDLDAGVWTALIFELAVIPNSNKSALDVYDEILFVDEGPEVPRPVSFSTVECCFPKIRVFEIDQESVFFDVDVNKILGYFLIGNVRPSLKFSGGTIAEFKLTFQNSSHELPYELVVHAYGSSHFKNSFVDLYRCVEKLYPIPSLSKLKETVLRDECSIELAAILESTISWRPIENNALEQLFKYLPESLRSEIETLAGQVNGAPAGAHNFIYRLRNSTVHYRKALGTLVVEDVQWDQLIGIMLRVIQNLYDYCEAQQAFSSPRVSTG